MLIITGYYETLDIFRNIDYCPNLLSIIDPDIPSIKPQICKFVDHYLELRFFDINQSEYGLIEPQKCHIDEIVRWAKSCQSHHGIIHCGAGISRSTAAGLITMCEWGYSETKAVETLIDLKPLACPNKLMLKLYGNVKLYQLVIEKGLIIS